EQYWSHAHWPGWARFQRRQQHCRVQQWRRYPTAIERRRFDRRLHRRQLEQRRLQRRRVD
ncbi:MAG: hypothetical protein Q8K72_21000, partial [Acidimicrobiales bacterium]|nr:hypothetical protein [Acidimicrobiales bacterium]